MTSANGKEKKTQVEDVKLAAAEQAKAAEDERLAGEKARLEAEKANPNKVASIAATEPASPDTAKSDCPAPPDIPRLLQTELRRVGCKSGDAEGEWNAASRRALSLFNDNAGTKFDTKLASIDALDAVKAKTGRVCPLDCERGFRGDGDHCVKITCESDQVLGPNGTCRARPERAPKVVAHRERRTPAVSGHGRCFAFNGRQVCE